MNLRAFAFLLLMAIQPLRAQLCDGTINFVLRSSGAGTDSGSVILFAGDVRGGPYWHRLQSDDGVFEVIVARADDGAFESPLMVLLPERGRGLTEIHYGCTGDYVLRIVRHGATAPDTMNIRFVHACEERFGMNIAFQQGNFTALVCDTARADGARGREANSGGYRYRLLRDQYPRTLYGGHDISGIVRRVDDER